MSYRTSAQGRISVIRRALDLSPKFTQLATFGLVGGAGFVIDVGLYNLLRVTVMSDQPIAAKVISVAVATAASWVGNRMLTFRNARGGSVVREAVLFTLINVIGLLISAGCLWISHYLLGYTSQLADNLSANGVGLVLGTTFRFLAYRSLVFRPTPTPGVIDRSAPTRAAAVPRVAVAGLAHAD